MLRMPKKNFPSFFLITCPQADHLQSKKLFFLRKFFEKFLFCKHYFSPRNTFMRKREGFGAGSAPLTNGSWSGWSKNMGIRIPNTGLESVKSLEMWEEGRGGGGGWRRRRGVGAGDPAQDSPPQHLQDNKEYHPGRQVSYAEHPYHSACIQNN